MLGRRSLDEKGITSDHLYDLLQGYIGSYVGEEKGKEEDIENTSFSDQLHPTAHPAKASLNLKQLNRLRYRSNKIILTKVLGFK